MPETVRHLIETFFSGQNVPLEKPVDFKWRLLRKKGHPFLLLPVAASAARAGLSLYSPQRRRAKVLHALLPAVLQTPAAMFFERLHFRADASSEIMQFMAQQSGVPAHQICPMAIKLSEANDRSRLVLLLCDESGRPSRVIKAGLNASGQSSITQEADLLEKLPADMLGCTRLTGRIATKTFSAFATNYFPGTSPDNDAGMEHLFHAWLNPTPPVPLESLELWHTLSKAAKADPKNWTVISEMLAGKKIRTTLYHGDFAPWNVRVVSSQNIQAFDWERGSFEGIPGWDWFHFFIQTSILARRHSAERTAAEVEQLIHSRRFKEYADAAGISDFVEPLMLAYLLNHCHVIKPLDGGQTTANLLEFLSAHWQIKSRPATEFLPRPRGGLLDVAKSQLETAFAQWMNLFWDPTINSNVTQPMLATLQVKWPIALAAFISLSLAGCAQFYSSIHLAFLPFHLVICAFVAWKIDRRWGSAIALIAAPIGPLVVALKDPEWRTPEIFVWNMVMRFLAFQTCVLFADHLHQLKKIPVSRPPNRPPAKLADVWAVLLASILSLFVIVFLDWTTDPRITFIPLYAAPCILVTLTLGLLWGIVTTVIAALSGVWVEALTSTQYSNEDFSWNFVMRSVIYLLLVVLADRFRRESVLFSPHKPRAH